MLKFMKANWFNVSLVAAVAILVASSSFAAEAAKKSTGQLVAEASTVSSDAVPAATTATIASETDQNYILGIDLRPTYYVKPENMGSENTIAAGIQFKKDLSLVYEQYIDTVVTGTESLGVDPKLRDGAARLLVNNIWTSGKLGLAFSYENRSFLPLNVDKRDAGRIIENRNYLKLKKDLGSNFALTVMEAPIFFAYSKDAPENSAFENRFYIVPEASLMDGKLAIGLPIWLVTTVRRDGNSIHKLLAWPEVTYTVTPGIDLGAAFYTENLMNPNFAGLDISNGLDNGAAQFVLRASL